MFNRAMKFLVVDRQQKRLFVEAFYLLGKVRLNLKRTPLKELIAGLDLHRSEVGSAPVGQAQLDVARLTGWAVRGAASFTPWESTCLVQVLAAQRMLEKRGIGGVFFLGADTEPDDRNAQGLSAHAWLKCGSEFVTGESGHEKYTVVSSFSWGS